MTNIPLIRAACEHAVNCLYCIPLDNEYKIEAWRLACAAVDHLDGRRPCLHVYRTGEDAWKIDGTPVTGIHAAVAEVMRIMDANGYETGMADMGPIQDGLEALRVGEHVRNAIPMDEEA
jgi:hypothetical protein